EGHPQQLKHNHTLRLPNIGTVPNDFFFFRTLMAKLQQVLKCSSAVMPRFEAKNSLCRL
ncbi:hypothetical protein RRG08_017401, partial [Elysia crispata]